MLRKIRITLAAIFFVGLTLLFLDFTGTLHAWLGWMAKVQFLPALLALNVTVIIVLVLLTLVFGRIYCSVICPLGVMQDVIAWFGKLGRKLPYSYSKAKNWLRYSVFVVFVIALIMGISSLVALLAPYSSFGRIVANLFQPIYYFANNILASISERIDSYTFYNVDVWMRSLPTFIVAVVTFVLIFVLAWRNGRTYCNTICPVGTLLGILSRFSWLKIYFDCDKCTSCTKCSRTCKAACIDCNTFSVDYYRCIVCGDCLDQCKFSSLRYGHPSRDNILANREKSASKVAKAKQRAEKKLDLDANKVQSANEQKPISEIEKSVSDTPKSSNEPVDASRRSFLISAAIATVGVAKAQTKEKVDGGLAVIQDKIARKRTTHITPPGSFSAMNMAKRCTGCQLCVSSCPNGVLRPSTDPMRFMQPELSYERGFCRPECTRCSEVCPTGAIQKIDKPTKASTQIGHAVWIQKNCVVVTDGVECGNCSRHCPTGAIEMIDLTIGESILSVPSVNTSVCIGCGACEYVCPARPYSAIYVEGHEIHKTY